MRLLAIMVSTLVLACGSIAYSQSYTRSGKVFEQQQKSQKMASEATKTNYTWKSLDGKEYTIYLSSKGSAYIIKTSKKTGKDYKQYLPKSVAKEIQK